MGLSRQTRQSRRNDGAEELTATARIDLAKPLDAKYLKRVVSLSRAKGSSPWRWYKEIGEVHYAVSRGAKIAGYAKLGAYTVDKNGKIGKQVTTGMAAEIAARLSSPYGGTRGLVDRFFTLTKIPGDAYLIRCRDEEGNIEGYDFISADEIDQASIEGIDGQGTGKVFSPNQSIRRITLPMNNGDGLGIDVEARDFIGRVWRPAGRFVDVADSPMFALETTCELLHLLTINLKAKLMSRMALNGILFVPSEINDIQGGTGPKPVDGEVFHDNRVLDELIRASTYAVMNYESPEAAIPIFMTGPGAFGDMIKHIIYDREIYRVDMELRQELIDRILMGLDVQPQNVRGLGDSNHWSAWAVSDEERRVNIQPDLETMCWALTRLVLWREMEEAGQKPGAILKTVIWYDMTDANVKTNLAEDARQMLDRQAISDSAARRMSGISEADAPTDEEYIRNVGRKMSDPYLATYGLAEADNIEWDKVGKAQPGPNAASPGDKPKSGPGVGDPGSPNDKTSNTPKRLRPA